VDPLSRQVRLDGEPLHVSKKEFALLRTLAEDPTRVFTREELLRGVWGFQSLGMSRRLRNREAAQPCGVPVVYQALSAHREDMFCPTRDVSCV
jgi:DNA-binding response OmpR family regulator